MSEITTIFFDVGGVLLTNGWDHITREAAATTFQYDYEEVEERHQQHVGNFECGRVSLKEYLNQVVFTESRSFTIEEYTDFMETQSQPHTENLELLRRLAKSDKYQLATVNNESLALNEYRINTYHLHESIPHFFSSCYMGVMKPDCDIFQRVLWITRQQGEQCLFVDDRQENVEAARSCGLRAAWLEKPSNLAEVLKSAGVVF
ncbi:HAD family hydrolase [Tunicatimonas pelagia]|uniref:HAD family hydrolase n=1 Tax=Tunicatimonas pelagia TaxID=931531 RepID=UPI002665675A|nr:HAD-IA family hydrolase [Tunicatimonas pelagia]WKN46057.1 HAD-IA family hydrolase [Tunicatimonas pelagia]